MRRSPCWRRGSAPGRRARPRACPGHLVPAAPDQLPAAAAALVPHTRRVQPWALAPAERTAILDVLHSNRFADIAPAEVWATLLDEGTYPGSVSTYYRVLREAGETRNGARRPPILPRSSPSWQPTGRARSIRGTSPSCTGP